MTYQILICSQDALFSHMLELEFSMHGCAAKAVEHFPEDGFAEIVLLDLDSVSAPPPSAYRRMIGFTRGELPAEEQARRRCSVILRRPFDLRLLRREVLGEGERHLPTGTLSAVRTPRLTMGQTASEILLDGEPLSLTAVETRVLEHLMAHRGEIVSREELSHLIGDSPANKVEVYVCYLRRKLAKLTQIPLITTVRGKGYVLK